VLVSVAAAEAAGSAAFERRTVEIRGRAEPIEVVIVRHASGDIIDQARTQVERERRANGTAG
jgi:hypothetical protein